ncbi:MAG: ribosome maturation factor RimP [Gammaproteobacteria bacterium RBG_16_57_12]|nr:MAG: ribosome maturation factor RimP [Gammaproteobacteria bacterium RBG_16_57_12]
MRRASPQIQALIEPVVAALGYELVGIEHLAQGRHSLLRIYIDSSDGIGVDDCEAVSHQVSGALEVEDPITGAYTLEVSSPGLDRPLFAPEHFERYTGSKVKVALHTPLNGRRRYVGVIQGCADGVISVMTEEGEVSIPFDSIDKANLVPEF